MTIATVLLAPLLMLISGPLGAIALPVDAIRPTRDGCRSKAACIGSGTGAGTGGRPMLLAKR